jgi:H+/Cl- antiporter ClcA
MIGDRRNRLLNRLTACGVFVFGAAALWLFAVLSSWWGDCPRGDLNLGQDKGISAWPPAGQCIDHTGGLYYWEAQPWVKPVILAFLACAFVILVASVVAAIRDRRTDSAKCGSPGGVPPS